MNLGREGNMIQSTITLLDKMAQLIFTSLEYIYPE